MTNIASDQINQFRSLLDQSQEVAIFVPKNPTLDDMAASLSLYLALSSRGKGVQVICPTPTTVEFSHLIGVDKVKNSLNGGTSGRNLVISFPYQEGSIEKVSYNIENDTFNLVIEPREGYPTVTSDMIQYAHSGGNVDFIITIGTAKLANLDNNYNNNQAIFSEKPVINIDSNAQNQRFGRINIVETNVSSISELTASLLSGLGFNLDADLATNLLYGITSGSQNFSSNTTSAYTFEVAALCLRSGAKKPTTSSPQAFPFPKTVRPFFPKPQAISSQPIPSSVYQPGPIINKPSQVKPPLTSPPSNQPAKQNPQPETPPDWLKPKIYKGSTLL